MRCHGDRSHRIEYIHRRSFLLVCAHPSILQVVVGFREKKLFSFPGMDAWTGHHLMIIITTLASLAGVITYYDSIPPWVLSNPIRSDGTHDATHNLSAPPAFPHEMMR